MRRPTRARTLAVRQSSGALRAVDCSIGAADRNEQLELFGLPPEISRAISSERRAVTEPTEEKLARRRYQKGQLLLLRNGWGVRFYEDAIENGERRRHRVQRFLGTLKELPTKRLAMRSMEDVLSSV